MRDLDETDLEILQLLMSDARRAYSDIAEVVGLSPPAVSERVRQLQEIGIIERFTLDIDRSQLQNGIPVLISLNIAGSNQDISSIKEELVSCGEVEHVFTTATADLVVYARVPNPAVFDWLAEMLDMDLVQDTEVTLVEEVDWSPDLGGAEFGLTCAQCGNTVDSEGTAARIDGDLYQFCCVSCETRFTDKYQELREGTG